jgi:hypothetical protein
MLTTRLKMVADANLGMESRPEPAQRRSSQNDIHVAHFLAHQRFNVSTF